MHNDRHHKYTSLITIERKMPSHEYELTTPISIKKEEALALLQDPKRFLIAGGQTEEDSIKYDEKTGKWQGE